MNIQKSLTKACAAYPNTKRTSKQECALWQRLSVTLLAVRTGSLQDEITVHKLQRSTLKAERK